MADEQKPGGSEASLPAGGEAAGQPAKPSPPKSVAAPPKPPATMAATPWESDLARELKERFGGQIGETSTFGHIHKLVFLTGILIRYIANKKQHENIIFVLRCVHATA